MKRLFSFLLIFLITATLSFADSIINDIDHFSKLFPMPEGSANEKEAIRHISKRLDELGIEYQETGFTETEGYHSYSSYIEAEIPGASNESLVSIIPVESSYGISAALYILEYYKETVPDLSLKFVFLGAESSSKNNLGTRNFLEHFYPEHPTTFLYMNFDEVPESFKIVSGADGFTSPFFLFDAVKSALISSDIFYFHSNTESILFRLSAAGTKSMIGDYLDDGYPAIELSSFESAGENLQEMISGEELINFYSALTLNLSSNTSSDWDSHYIFGFREEVYIIVYIVLITMLMIYPIFKRRHFGWYMKTLIKNYWNLILILVFVYIFLALTSSLILLIFSRISFPELWLYLPILTFLFKISMSLLLFTLAFKLISKLPFTRRGSFYSISAIVTLVISLFIFTMINLSLSFFALWSLCFIFLFTIFRKPAIKFILLILSALWIVFILIEIFTLPSFRVIELITVSPLQGDLLIALIILPFMLSAVRLELLKPLPAKFTHLLPVILTLSTIGLFAALVFYSPFNESNPQPVSIFETIEENNNTQTIVLDSPAGVNEEVEERLVELMSPETTNRKSIQFEIRTKSFLNRKIINTNIDFDEQPEKVSITISSENPLTIFESNYPTQWFPAQKRLEIFIGNNPPLPLEISITLNRDAKANFTIQADFPTETRRVETGEDVFLVSYKKTVVNFYPNEE